MRMKTHIVIFMLITSLLGLIGCQELGDKDTSRVKAEIEASVKQASKDWEEYPKSLDRPRLLKYYADDYSGVKDGASETLKDLEKSFDDLAEAEDADLGMIDDGRGEQAADAADGGEGEGAAAQIFQFGFAGAGVAGKAFDFAGDFEQTFFIGVVHYWYD